VSCVLLVILVRQVSKKTALSWPLHASLFDFRQPQKKEKSAMHTFLFIHPLLI